MGKIVPKTFGTNGTETEEDRSSQEEYSSWGRTRSKSVLHPLTKASSMTTEVDKNAQEAEVVQPSLRRIRSTVSLLSLSAKLPPPSTKTNNSRTPPTQSTRPSYTRRSSGHAVGMPSLSMSTYAPPSIRRKNTSHPDITSLVEQWTSSGPANHITTYKPYKKAS